MKREKHSSLIEQLAPYPAALMRAETQRCPPKSSRPERKPAHWIKITGMRPPEHAGRHVCSECGGMALENRMREVLSEYCPYCGAKLGD